ncbi:hypothetical protein A2U01_0113487, partial [Trifolium medium]|nr:hypothetical protein [Trifolium medium]
HVVAFSGAGGARGSGVGMVAIGGSGGSSIGVVATGEVAARLLCR